ncbi:MAG: endonuclease domain-containing protein [Planctomycetota bacterium]
MLTVTDSTRKPKRKLPRPSPEIIRRAKQLRQHMTIPERMLWNVLRTRSIHGLKFRRQTPIDRFIVDFYCPAIGLVIELDGMSHVGHTEQDRKRTDHLQSLGLRVVRYTNDQIIHNLDAVYLDLMNTIEKLEFDPRPAPSPNPSLKGGG